VATASLILRPVRASDEATVRAARVSLAADDFDFAVGWAPDISWSEYVELLDDVRRARELPEPWVPATFLLAEVQGTVVGRTSIRHRLNEYLLSIGGHIGYAVLAEHRRRGYASEILRQSVVIARSYDVGGSLVTCDEHNEASSRTILRNGGVLENIVDTPNRSHRTKRFWIG